MFWKIIRCGMIWRFWWNAVENVLCEHPVTEKLCWTILSDVLVAEEEDSYTTTSSPL